MEKDIGFREKIFTAGEITYCETKKHKYENYAARFPPKKPLMKAIGTGWRFGIRFADIEVYHDEIRKTPDPALRESRRAGEGRRYFKNSCIFIACKRDRYGSCCCGEGLRTEVGRQKTEDGGRRTEF